MGLLDLARAWQVSVETGGPMSSMLDQVATSLSADQSLTGVVNRELAAARATSKVMAACLFRSRLAGAHGMHNGRADL